MSYFSLCGLDTCVLIGKEKYLAKKQALPNIISVSICIKSLSTSAPKTSTLKLHKTLA